MGEPLRVSHTILLLTFLPFLVGFRWSCPTRDCSWRWSVLGFSGTKIATLRLPPVSLCTVLETSPRLNLPSFDAVGIHRCRHVETTLPSRVFKGLRSPLLSLHMHDSPWFIMHSRSFFDGESFHLLAKYSLPDLRRLECRITTDPFSTTSYISL